MSEWSLFIKDSDVYITSEDFTHDIWLEVPGDFETIVQKIQQAEKIIDSLNENKQLKEDKRGLVKALEDAANKMTSNKLKAKYDKIAQKHKEKTE